ncbi:unnamed protein product [Miscanthus lutarioriparius]|uniref:F-box domain-containing protein n=1 Tax=Miscanthus lutarioriparius TaxID=422564 RepID=A0A811NVQ4_9POAL|nr:unnamed protein product [Miscanthus lutarioriparius]
MAPRPAPPAALMDELVEEILLRIPPDDPARLLRAVLVCKRWRRIVSDPRFRRRFREFHRTPPMLGFLRNHGRASSFVSTSSFRAPPADRVNSRAIDARHGRVLLQSRGPSDRKPWEDAFHVWDPTTGERRKLPVLLPGPVYPWSWNAAVLCAAATEGCEHLDCHRGPLLVVFVGSGKDVETSAMCAHVYSSESDSWSQQISAPQFSDDIRLEPSALAENALYFRCMHSVLKYDLATRELSLIVLPEKCFLWGRAPLMATEDGGLGLAYIRSSNCTCGRGRLALTMVQDGQAKSLSLPAHDNTLVPMVLTGFAHGLDVFFVRTSVGIFTIDLKSISVTKVCEESCCDESFPYMSFCTPALGAAFAEVSRTGTSNA